MTVDLEVDQVYGLFWVMLHCDRHGVIVNEVNYTDDKFVMRFKDLGGKLTVLDSTKVETEDFPWDEAGTSVMNPYDFLYRLRLNYPLLPRTDFPSAERDES